MSGPYLSAKYKVSASIYCRGCGAEEPGEMTVAIDGFGTSTALVTQVPRGWESCPLSPLSWRCPTCQLTDNLPEIPDPFDQTKAYTDAAIKAFQDLMRKPK